MPRKFSVLDLITRGRRRCDQENRDVLSAAEWKEELSTIKSEFDGELIDSGMRYFEKTSTLTTVTGQNEYLVPSDFLAMVGIDYVQGDGQKIELVPMLAQERNYFTGTQASGQSVAYQLIGQNIKFGPPPSGGQTYEIVFVPQPADISDAGDKELIDVVIPAGEAFFVYSLALVGAIKEEHDLTPYFERRVEFWRERVKEWAMQRELYTPKRRYVHGEGSNRFDGDGLGNSGYIGGEYIY